MLVCCNRHQYIVMNVSHTPNQEIDTDEINLNIYGNTDILEINRSHSATGEA